MDLLHQAMTKIAGREVRLRWQKPALAHGLAACWVDASTKVARIDIQPYMSTDTTLHVLAHEASHIRLCDAPVLGGEAAQLRPGGVTVADDFRQAQRAHPREAAADRLADLLVTWAQKNASRYFYDDVLERCLAAWANMPESELAALIRTAR